MLIVNLYSVSESYSVFHNTYIWYICGTPAEHRRMHVSHQIVQKAKNSDGLCCLDVRQTPILNDIYLIFLFLFEWCVRNHYCCIPHTLLFYLLAIYILKKQRNFDSSSMRCLKRRFLNCYGFFSHYKWYLYFNDRINIL